MGFDIVLAILIAFLSFRGWRRGLIGEIVETIGVFVAAIVTIRLYPKMEDMFGLSSTWGSILLAVIIFVALMIALTLLAKGIRHMLQKASLGPVEKTLGLMFGAVKAGLIIAVLTVILLRVGDDGKKIVQESVVARTNLRVFAWIANFLPEEWEKKVDEALLNE